MTCRAILILFAALMTLAQCVAPASNCAGWRRIQASAEAVDWLNAHDREALAQIVAHDEFGAQMKCWN